MQVLVSEFKPYLGWQAEQVVNPDDSVQAVQYIPQAGGVVRFVVRGV